MKQKYLMLVLVVFTFGCQNEINKNENTEYDFNTEDDDKQFIYSVLSDTTTLYNLSSNIDSTNQDFEHFVKDNKRQIKGKTVEEIDALFLELIEGFEKYNRIQRAVNVEIEKRTERREKLTYNTQSDSYEEISYYELIIENKSDRYINALVLDVGFFDVYQELLFDSSIEYVEDIAPGKKFVERVDRSSKFSTTMKNYLKYEDNYRKGGARYVVTKVKKIVFSKDQNLESKLDGEIIDYSGFNFPNNLSIKPEREVHSLHSD